MMETRSQFVTKLRWQRHFADRPLRGCRFNCYDPHPKVQALVAADMATMEARLQAMRIANTYAAKEAENA